MDRKQLEAAVDQEIDAFESKFQALGNTVLAPSERAILKTYFATKLLEKVTG